MNNSTLPQGAIAGPVQPARPKLPFNGFLIVGEAPGATEAILGKPFVGPAGLLLTQALRTLAVDRDATLIANVFRYQPTWTATADGKRRSNDISTFFTDDPSQAAQGVTPYHGRSLHASHAPDIAFFRDLVKSTAPKRIVAMGSVALWALTGQDRIKQNRGKILSTSLSIAPVFPTFHTAFALHRNDDAIMKQIEDDLRMAFSA